MNIDLSFITNEKKQSLKKRFEVLIKDTSFFDCLVGYFYSSGFHAIYRSLENTEKIRILIGISTNRQTSITEQKLFADLVNQILSITKSVDYFQNSQKQAKVKSIEAEIDQLVYKLYDLTPEEIKIVEGAK